MTRWSLLLLPLVVAAALVGAAVVAWAVWTLVMLAAGGSR